MSEGNPEEQWGVAGGWEINIQAQSFYYYAVPLLGEL